ncbi:histone deacetylase family protein [Phycisphaera mikurensis]|uniref:Putative deacetylase n=1 Tax=Phycisphaera mikurensis (strain NBRC 102666 / KCTC 22515 / FYK2301M01) TaxID=1142394 RepID=I0ICS7_PHYMF|nr:histone deacetylase [Phycisphaera mikurensis]MBB6443314.1 acetoin utilization deacetylase AcuC-like enzyme [Phycisphaera mikurensis]BAM03065.1 putative deacetylase [Phycisphaera mikurensis NBRC 102666]
MSTGLIYDDRLLLHDTGPTHPERPDRLRAVMDRLRADGLAQRTESLYFATAGRHRLGRLHTPAYLDRLDAACAGGEPIIDDIDSCIGRVSADVARLALGGILRVTEAVGRGELNNAFCATRPPGHHAEADRSMGYCLYANAAFAADLLTTDLGLDRVAVVDFDVHHGNGTQHLMAGRGDVLALSIHGNPAVLYPGTGFEHETGEGSGEGATVNVCMPPGAGDADYLHAFRERVIPALEAFRPEALVLAAGFDASVRDPLAPMRVTDDGFRQMTRLLLDAADRLCGGKVVSILEGGYDLEGLAGGVAAHVGVLLEA